MLINSHTFKDPTLKLTIVGDGPAQTYVEKFVKRNELVGKVSILGMVHRARVVTQL